MTGSEDVGGFATEAGGTLRDLAAGGADRCCSSGLYLLEAIAEPMTQGWEIKERLDHLVDAVVDSGDCGMEPTTVVDLSTPEPEILRDGAGDPLASSSGRAANPGHRRTVVAACP